MDRNMTETSYFIEIYMTKLITKLSHKRVEIIEIYGKCNKDGVLKVTFNEPLEFSTDNDYLVKLVSAELVSFVPNIIEGKNNKLLYKLGEDSNEIPDKLTPVFQTNAYKIPDINQHVQEVLRNRDSLYN